MVTLMESNETPHVLPPEYQSTILSAIQITADIKKYRGDGKNDLNIEC